MKRVLFIQARMGSTRLPGKVLMDIAGKTMLARVIERSSRAKWMDSLLVATTALERDNVIVEEAHLLGVRTFRGDEEDVLDRFYQAARVLGADLIVRITSDCPFLEPEIIDKVTDAFLKNYPKANFVSNTVHRTYPRGLEVEVSSFEALERTWRQAREPYQRTHAFPYIYENQDQFQVLSVTDPEDHSWMRWTVDTREDLEFARAVYERLQDKEFFSWREVLSLLEQEPGLLAINSHVQQKLPEEG